MATLRDIRNLYGSESHCFYAGFGNRLTDQISYRTVDVPRNRIFTINANAEVSLDLLSLNKLNASKGAIAFFFLYYISFAIGMLGVPWLYPTEINSLPMRTKGVAELVADSRYLMFDSTRV